MIKPAKNTEGKQHYCSLNMTQSKTQQAISFCIEETVGSKKKRQKLSIRIIDVKELKVSI